jgi:uncharacterized RDD family membrane protein YckC
MYPNHQPFIHKKTPIRHYGFLAKTNLRKRVAACFIDFGIMMVFILLNLYVFLKTGKDGSLILDYWIIAPVISYWIIYFVILEAFFGATLGHQILHLKVLTLERKKIGLEQALKRHLLDLVDYYLLCVPSLIAIFNSEKHQRIGDMWAGTLVIDLKDSEQHAQ